MESWIHTLRNPIYRLTQILLYVFDIEIVGVEAAVISDTAKSLWIKPTSEVIPDFPQLEAELVNAPQRSPVAEQFTRWLGLLCEVARMELDHQLFDVGQTSWRGEYGVEWRPLRALDVNLHYVDRRLQRNVQNIPWSFSYHIISL